MGRAGHEVAIVAGPTEATGGGGRMEDTEGHGRASTDAEQCIGGSTARVCSRLPAILDASRSCQPILKRCPGELSGGVAREST